MFFLQEPGHVFHIKRKQNIKYKHRSKLRNNLVWLYKATQAERAATTDDREDQLNSSEPRLGYQT
jgi:hypothetical protein